MTSSVNLTGASLDVTLGAGFNPAVGTSFEIISNTGGGGVAGTFTNLPEGSVTMIGGLPFVVSYIGGDGDDVTLTRTSATLTSDPVGPIMPGTSVTFTATIANGNSANAGTVSFYYDYGLSNQVQIGNPVDLVNGSATSDATTTLPVGSDVVTAVYTDGTGASGILATLTIQVGSTPPPSIASVVINQNISSLYNAAGQPAPGTQRSMVNDIVYTFNEPVNIVGAGADPNVFTISVAPGWTGTVPTLSSGAGRCHERHRMGCHLQWQRSHGWVDCQWRLRHHRQPSQRNHGGVGQPTVDPRSERNRRRHPIVLSLVRRYQWR